MDVYVRSYQPQQDHRKHERNALKRMTFGLVFISLFLLCQIGLSMKFLINDWNGKIDKDSKIDNNDQVIDLCINLLFVYVVVGIYYKWCKRKLDEILQMGQELSYFARHNRRRGNRGNNRHNRINLQIPTRQLRPIERQNAPRSFERIATTEAFTN